MVSALAMTDPTTWPISGLNYGPVQVSGDSTTPSPAIISPATIFRIASPSSAPGGQPLRPLSLVLRTGNPGMDTGREILWPASPAGWQPGHSQREAPRPPGIGPRSAPARVRGKDLLPARQHHGHRPGRGWTATSPVPKTAAVSRLTVWGSITGSSLDSLAGWDHP